MTAIDGFELASLIDASTGMVLASAQERDDISLPLAAAGATDIAAVLGLLSSELATEDDLEDVMVTFNKSFPSAPASPARPYQSVILLVVLDRTRANLAMARRAIRNFCATFS